MKPSERIVFDLLPQLLTEKDKFIAYINVFEDAKISDFFIFLVENINKEEYVIKENYSSSSYKSYKSILRKHIVNYLILTKLDSTGSKIRHSINKCELYSEIKPDLVKETEQELNAAYKLAKGDAFINLRTIILGYKLRNARKLPNFSFSNELSLMQEMNNTIGINHFNVNTYLAYLKIAQYYTHRSFPRTIKEYNDLKILEEELINIKHPINNHNSTAVGYVLQAKTILYIMLNKPDLCYNYSMKTLEFVQAQNYPDENFKAMQLYSQIANTMLYGFYSQKFDDFKKLFQYSKELEENNVLEMESYKSLITFFYNYEKNNGAKLEDVQEIESMINDKLPAMFYSIFLLITSTSYAKIGNFDLARNSLKKLYYAEIGKEIKTDIKEYSQLLECIFTYEKCKNDLKKNNEELRSFLKKTYDKFRKKKNIFPIEIIILKQLQKIKLNNASAQKLKIFTTMSEEIKACISSNIIAKNYYNYFNFYFSIDNWINENINQLISLKE